MAKIESVQRQITRYICNKMNIFYKNYNHRLEILKLKSIEMRRNLKILTLIHKIKNDKYNVLYNLKYRFNFIETRNGTKIVKPYNVVNFCDRNFVIYSIHLYNTLPNEVRCEEKLSPFLSKCEKYFKSIAIV